MAGAGAAGGGGGRGGGAGGGGRGAAKNGRAAECDAIHVWTFDGKGRGSAYRHFNDTAAELAAWRD